MSYTLVLLSFIAGFLIGGLLFSDTKPRSLLRILANKNNFTNSTSSDIAGLFASIIVQKTPWLIPSVITETDKTIVFRHPRPKYRIHYLFVPKKDIKNIGELAGDDAEHILDLFATIVSVINQLGVTNYRLWTNGPAKQDVTYLHFHLGVE